MVDTRFSISISISISYFFNIFSSNFCHVLKQKQLLLWWVQSVSSWAILEMKRIAPIVYTIVADIYRNVQYLPSEYSSIDTELAMKGKGLSITWCVTVVDTRFSISIYFSSNENETNLAKGDETYCSNCISNRYI